MRWRAVAVAGLLVSGLLFVAAWQTYPDSPEAARLLLPAVQPVVPPAPPRDEAVPGPAATGIEGRVVLPDGTPVVGALVYAHASPLGVAANNMPMHVVQRQATATWTDADGAFRIETGADTKILEVRHEGVAPASLAVQDLPVGEAWTLHAAPAVTPIAHRGGAAYAPENTVAAIRTAALMGAKAVEFDVQLTLDREPVLFHDLELDRTTNGSGLVGLHTLAELRALDAGSWFGADYAGEPIPTLAEALAEVKAWGLTAVLELKPGRVSPTGGAHLEIPTDALIFERSAQVAGEVNLTLGQIIYTSFGMAGSHACGRFSPAACGWIISKELDRGQEQAIMPAVSGVDVLVLHHSHVDAGRVQRIHTSCDYLAHASTCPSVIAYTVNGVVGLLAMAAAGVDGVVTDNLDVAYGVLASA